MTEPRIISDPKIMMGKPVVRGTRVTVELLLRLAASRLTVTDIVREYPHLTIEDVQAAYSFATDLARDAWLSNTLASRAIRRLRMDDDRVLN
jgi:uncharacterized protein (DUF433 family)